MGGTLQPINLKKDYKNRDILDYVRWNADQQAIENVANKLINSTEDGDSGADNISMTAIQSISTATSLQSFLEALAAMLISAQAAAKLGAVAPDADISGNNIQAILNSLKTYIDSALNTLSDNMDSMNASLVGNINKRVKSADLAKTDGTGGSNIVGSQSIIGVQGNTVYQQLLGLKQLIDDIEAGVLPDGYIDNAKLADDIKIGSLLDLATSVKTSVVNAINEIVNNIGSLSSLSTTDKTNIISALNEVLGNVGDKANLTTVNKTSLVGAVNEVKSALTAHKSENASTTTKGHIQLATAEEAVAGTDTAKAVTSAGLKARFASHLIPQSTLHEDTLASTISIGNTEKKAVAVGLKGRTVINLLGSDGDCESLSKFGTWQSTLSLNTSNKIFGSNSIKITLTSTAGDIKYSIFHLVDFTKFYCVSAYVKNGDSSSMDLIWESDSGGTPSTSSSATNFKRIWCKVNASSNISASYIKITARVYGTSGQYGYVDGIMLNEITEAEYNDPDYEPPEYVNSNVDVVNPVVESCGKNLCPSFDKWFIPSGYILVGSNTIQTSIESDWKCQSQVFAVKPNTQYAISADITGPDPNTRISIIWLDKSKAFVFNEWGATVSAPSVVLTSPPNAYYAYINLLTETGTGLRTFSNIQLEESSVATEYEPYKGKGVQVPYTLRECGGARDEITKDGKLIHRVGYKVLDGSLDWAYSGGDAECKEAFVDGMGTNVISGEEFCIKYNGKILSHSSEFANDTVYYATIGRIIVRIPNLDSGWGDAYTPTPKEIKAYFNGWIMRSSSGTQYNDATGSEVKRWQAALSNINAPWNPTGEDYYNTGICPYNRIAPNYTPYRLYYQLAQPIIEDIPPILLPVPPQGSISVDSNIMPLLNYELMDNARAQIDSIMDGLAGAIGSILNTPICRVYSDLAQSIPNNQDTKIVFNKVETDTDNNVDYTDRSKIKINTSGKYIISANVNFELHADGIRGAFIAVNNNNSYDNRLIYLKKSPDDSGFTIISLNTIAELNAGDCINVWAYQNCGEAISTYTQYKFYTNLSIVKVGD